MANTVAIDIGTTAARAVWLRGSPGNLQVAEALRVEMSGEEPVASLVSQLKNRKAPLGAVALGVSGQAATLRYNLLPPVPEWRLDLIMKYETEELSEKSGEPLSNDYLRLEIPESQVDDQILLMGLGKDNLIEPQLEAIESRGGRVSRAMPVAFGLYHAYLTTQGAAPTETVLLAHVGAEETHIVLVTEGRLLFARSVNFGGTQFDEAIASSMSIKPEAARRLKEGIRRGENPGGLVESAQPAIRTGLGQLISVLQSSVTFCRAQVKISDMNIDRVLVSGGGSLLPQVSEFLAQGFRLPVEPLRPPIAGELPGSSEEWVIAIGLAAAAMDGQQRYLDLLPPASRQKRDFRERTRFLYGAAAMAVLGVIVYLGVGVWASSSVQADTADLAREEQRINKLMNQYQQAEDENEKIRSRIDRVHRELEHGRFTARVMGMLRSELPTAIHVERLSTRRVETDVGGFVIELTLEGKADDSDKKAIARCREFKTALERIPGVKRVVPKLGDSERGFVTFTVMISPDDKPEKTKRPRRGPRGRGRGNR